MNRADQAERAAAHSGRRPTVSSLDAWRGAAAREVGAERLVALFRRTDSDGIPIAPVYGPDNADAPEPGWPASADHARGALPLGSAWQGWEVRQLYAQPTPHSAAEAIAQDLEGGVEAVVIRTTAGPGGGCDIETADDLERVLAPVDLAGVPVYIEAGPDGFRQAQHLAEVWRRRGLPPASARGGLQLDPLGWLASAGWMPAGAVERAAALAVEACLARPGVATFCADARQAHAAGATRAECLGVALAAGLAYLRAMEAAGLPPDAASGQIRFAFPLGSSLLRDVAMLRAGRRVWRSILAACGVSDEVAGDARTDSGHVTGMRADAWPAWRSLTARDPWGNLLRGATTAVAAALGGADSVVVAPLDAAVTAAGSNRGRRTARNAQHVLREESRLASVIDPVGGSHYLEHLTDGIGRAAWSTVVWIERQGGLQAALVSSALQARLAASASDLAERVARRRLTLVGVNRYAQLDERPLPGMRPDARGSAGRSPLGIGRGRDSERGAESGAEPRAEPEPRLGPERGAGTGPGPGPGPATERRPRGDLVVAAPLPRLRLAAPFEVLRDAADERAERSGARPSVFLVQLGPPRDHGGRANLARDLLAAGGIEAVAGASEGSSAATSAGSVPGSGDIDGADAVAAFRGSGLAAAVVSGSDAAYLAVGPAIVRELKASGAKGVWLVGEPGSDADGWLAAGLDGFLHEGCDAVCALMAIAAAIDDAEALEA